MTLILSPILVKPNPLIPSSKLKLDGNQPSKINPKERKLSVTHLTLKESLMSPILRENV